MTLSSRDVKSCVPAGDFSSRVRSHIPVNIATFNWEGGYGCIRINLTAPSKTCGAFRLDLPSSSGPCCSHFTSDLSLVFFF